MKPYIDIQIQHGTDTSRHYLLGLVRDTYLGIDANVVYIYSLTDDVVNYPEKPGHVIYIGEAGRASEPTGKRFAQHISTSQIKGGDRGTIYALSRYYWQGKRIRLQVLLVEEKQSRKDLERKLLNAHVREYGALPICQGTTGGNYGTTTLNSMIIPPEHLALFEPAF